MKKAFSLILSLVLCLGLCACIEKSSNPSIKKLSVNEVQAALNNSDWRLDVKTSGDSVSHFTVTVTDINADDLLNKTFAIKAINNLLAGTARPTEYQVCRGILPVIQIITLFDSGLQGEDAIYGTVLSIICDHAIMEYEGWNISAKVDQSTDCITITVAPAK